MKHTFFAALCVAIIHFVPVQAQALAKSAVSDTFRVQKIPFRVWYGTQKMRNLKQIGAIVRTSQDQEVNLHWRKLKTTQTIGTGAMVLGAAIGAIGLVQQSKRGTGIGLSIGGSVVLLSGVIIQSTKGRRLRHLLKHHNDLVLGRAAVSRFGPK